MVGFGSLGSERAGGQNHEEKENWHQTESVHGQLGSQDSPAPDRRQGGGLHQESVHSAGGSAAPSSARLTLRSVRGCPGGVNAKVHTVVPHKSVHS